jgi:hypothetical protein
VASESAVRKAFQKGLRAAWQNLPAILALEFAMASVVATYYCWPAGAAFLSRYAAWQHSGGIFGAAVATALAGGLLSEVSLVYFQQRGHWSRINLENVVFKLAIFFISGAIVFEFYQLQAFWFGQGATWSILVPKVIVDQFGYTVFWSTPFYAITTRWHALGYSFQRLWPELRPSFITERMLPILVTNWMFWIPGVSLIYSMPSILQTPLFIFAIAIWGLLLAAVTKKDVASSSSPRPTPAGGPVILGQTVD